MTFFINVLSPSIQTIVARSWENQPRSTLAYNALVQFSQDEIKAFHAQARKTRDICTQQTRNQNVSTSTINLIDESARYSDKITDGLQFFKRTEAPLSQLPLTISRLQTMDKNNYAFNKRNEQQGWKNQTTKTVAFKSFIKINDSRSGWLDWSFHTNMIYLLPGWSLLFRLNALVYSKISSESSMHLTPTIAHAFLILHTVARKSW